MSKILSFILSILFFCSSVVYANENQPEQTSNDNIATISVQKQPATENMQKQIAKQNKWCIIIQVNGKIKEVENKK